MSFNLSDWYSENTARDVLLAYKGSVSSEMITGTLEQIEVKLDEDDTKSKLRKKVYNVLVESLQNLYHHTDVAPTGEYSNLGDKFAVIVFAKETEAFRITTGNFVQKNRLKVLKDRLDQINQLDKTELKALYKMILNNEEFSDKGGGGLGMIDIARKTGNQLVYKFYDYNNDYYFFSLEVLVN